MSQRVTLKGAIVGVMDAFLETVAKKLPASYVVEKWKITVAPGGDAADLQFHGYDKNDLECRGIVRVELEAGASLRLKVIISFSSPLRDVNETRFLGFEQQAAREAAVVVKLISG